MKCVPAFYACEVKLMNKIFGSAFEAIYDIKDNMTLMLGGFGLCGIPENLILALREKGVKGLTCISNNAGVSDFGISLLFPNKQVVKMISSYVGENDLFEKMVLNGELEIEMNPQGTLAERIRAGGAGIGGFFTPTGFGTVVAGGKETRVIDGKNYVLESPLKADFSLVKAYKADKMGNLIYRKTARNFNPMMAMAGKITIAEVEEIVEVGELDPEAIVTPGIYVQRLIKGEKYEKRIEQRTVRKV